MLRLTWLTVAQHVFQPALTGRLELISRKIVSCEPGTKAIAVSRFREKLSPANWVQGVTAISRKKYRALGRQKMGSNMRPRYIQFRDIRDRDISGLHCTVLCSKSCIRGTQCHQGAWWRYGFLSACSSTGCTKLASRLTNIEMVNMVNRGEGSCTSNLHARTSLSSARSC